MGRRAIFTLLVLATVLGAAILLRLLIGSPTLSPADIEIRSVQKVFEWPASESVRTIRIQRACSGAIVGAALAVAGAMLQCLLRNPLASPDLLGLASGSGFGVMLAAYVAYRAGAEIAPTGASIPAALAGALGSLALVYTLSQRPGLIEPVTLILVGVIASIVCGSATVFVQYLMPDRGMAASRWLLGALNDDNTTGQLVLVGGMTATAIVTGALLGRQMDAATLSEDEARSLGVRLGGLRATLFVLSGVLTAGAVVLAGPIGFVGLVCPHVVRLGAGPSHRTLVIGSALAGAALVVLADALVKGIDFGNGCLPIGVITSVIGGPVLVWMLRSRRG